MPEETPPELSASLRLTDALDTVVEVVAQKVFDGFPALIAERPQIHEEPNALPGVEELAEAYVVFCRLHNYLEEQEETQK